jgi:hypothetical protein
MSKGSPAAFADDSETSVRTTVAAVLVLVALAAVAAYALFSGPTMVPAPPSGSHQATPGKAAPAGERNSPEREGGDGR